MEPPSPALNGYFKTFADQIEALKIAYREALHRLAPQMWSWGGGNRAGIVLLAASQELGC
jgi:hypothetical protein